MSNFAGLKAYALKKQKESENADTKWTGMAFSSLDDGPCAEYEFNDLIINACKEEGKANAYRDMWLRIAELEKAAEEEMEALFEECKYNPEQIGIKLLREAGHRVTEYSEGDPDVWSLGGERLLYW